MSMEKGPITWSSSLLIGLPQFLGLETNNVEFEITISPSWHPLSSEERRAPFSGVCCRCNGPSESSPTWARTHRASRQRLLARCSWDPSVHTCGFEILFLVYKLLLWTSPIWNAYLLLIIQVTGGMGVFWIIGCPMDLNDPWHLHKAFTHCRLWLKVMIA